jgi:hypothetical protein
MGGARTLRYPHPAVSSPELFALRDAAEHRRVCRRLVALVRDAGARRARVRMHGGELPTLYLRDEDVWLAYHGLPNRYRNAFGVGDPTTVRSPWPSVQLNLALAPGSARPHAIFVRDARDRIWIAHSGQLGGRLPGISRDGFLRFLGGAQDVRIDGALRTLVVLGTFASPRALLGQIARLTHSAAAFRGAIAAGGSP